VQATQGITADCVRARDRVTKAAAGQARLQRRLLAVAARAEAAVSAGQTENGEEARLRGRIDDLHAATVAGGLAVQARIAHLNVMQVRGRAGGRAGQVAGVSTHPHLWLCLCSACGRRRWRQRAAAPTRWAHLLAPAPVLGVRLQPGLLLRWRTRWTTRLSWCAS
jgi:hypothetical protein